MTQSEHALELALMQQLQSMEYDLVPIANEADMLANLKKQLEIHNKTTFSKDEFNRILAHLNRGGVIDRARLLRDRYELKRDEVAGQRAETTYIRFLNSDEWCMNEFQVAQQVSMEGKRNNRYDVTLLINGLPLVQIELKRRGTELKVAFNQINRYKHESYDAGYGLFQYVQIFIISNGVNTKYFANSNSRNHSYQQTFYWTDKNNERISDLHLFTADFLRACHIAKMIAYYIVIGADGVIRVMRPYQFYATEALVDKIKNTQENAYIWHTTGSGKTLTSFKASQIIMNLPKVHKVLFVVDRKDLDFQTAQQFNAFSEGSVDNTNNTRHLIHQLNDPNCKLIVTTLQKLNNAITRDRYAANIKELRNKKIVFIFDECHRSQFGETHQAIKKYFYDAQMIGFTGTPIFVENRNTVNGAIQTTRDLFGECLHKYVIVDAIKDDNVLRFSVEYVGKYTYKDSANQLDIAVEEIDTQEILESPQRIEKIVDYILAHHDSKTRNREFTGMFCVSNIETLKKYYALFQQKKSNTRPIKVATIFSYAANEEDLNATGILKDSASEVAGDYQIHPSSRDALDTYIDDYNKLFHTEYSTKDSETFYNYYKDIAKRVKNAEIDILLVVNMFLTGFDSPLLNTLYVDKNLKYHGLIQAFSRTNRILNDKKSQGNIVCFRNLKTATDDAIALFSNKNAREVVLLEPYETYVNDYNKAVAALKNIVPNVQSVDALPDEQKQKEFITAYRELMRIKNVLQSFADYDPEDLQMPEQEFEDYKSKYLDLYETFKNRSGKEKVSVLDEVDFELSLIHRDEINVAYILNLLKGIQEGSSEEVATKKKAILDLLTGEAQLRNKRELILEFIEQNLPKISSSENVLPEFEEYWQQHQEKALRTFCEEEQLHESKMLALVQQYIYYNRFPYQNELLDALNFSPKILERKVVLERVGKRFKEFVATFIEGMGGSV